jgi:hypothetical protein
MACWSGSGSSSPTVRRRLEIQATARSTTYLRGQSPEGVGQASADNVDLHAQAGGRSGDQLAGRGGISPDQADATAGSGQGHGSDRAPARSCTQTLSSEICQ